MYIDWLIDWQVLPSESR